MSQLSSQLDIGFQVNFHLLYCEAILVIHNCAFVKRLSMYFSFEKSNFINEINGTLCDSCTVVSLWHVMYVWTSKDLLIQLIKPRGQLPLVETPLGF